MTIQGPKKLFKELKVKKITNENWEDIIEKGHFFYKQ